MKSNSFDVVKDVEEVSLDGVGVRGLAQDLQQGCVRDKEEPRKQQALLLQIAEREDNSQISFINTSAMFIKCGVQILVITHCNCVVANLSVRLLVVIYCFISWTFINRGQNWQTKRRGEAILTHNPGCNQEKGSMYVHTQVYEYTIPIWFPIFESIFRLWYYMS